MPIAAPNSSKRNFTSASTSAKRTSKRSGVRKSRHVISAGSVAELFAQEFRRGQPEELTARWRQSLQFDSGDTRLLQSGDVMLRTNRGSDQIIKLRSVAKAKNDGGIFLSRDLFEEMRRLSSRKERVGSANPLFRIIESRGKKLGGLHRANVRATDQQIGADFETGDALGDLLRLLDAFFG